MAKKQDMDYIFIFIKIYGIRCDFYSAFGFRCSDSSYNYTWGGAKKIQTEAAVTL